MRSYVFGNYRIEIGPKGVKLVDVRWEKTVVIPTPSGGGGGSAGGPSTVFTLAGFGVASIAANWYSGELFASPNVMKKITYPNNNIFDLAGGAARGMALVTDCMRTTQGNLVFVGHSMGAQVLCKWLREVGPTSDTDPGRVRFILTGNPERKYNGLIAMRPGVYPPAYGGIGVPEGTPYRVVDWAQQYDRWADYPNNWGDTDAETNASTVVHVNYTKASLNNPLNRSFTEGNITYTWTPTYPLPSVSKLWISKAEKKSEDIERRPDIEACYDRPVSIPLPDYENL